MALYDELGASRGVRILAFPCNQFGGQEPGSNEEIRKFATENYAATFDLFSKVDVNGENAAPLYKYLKYKQGGTFGDFIKWNFTKFVIDKKGQPVKRYAPTVDPATVKKDLEKFL